MLITELKFDEVLDWFHESHYKFMMLFVSSFDNKDYRIIKTIYNSRDRIDIITGNSICYFLFANYQVIDPENNKAAKDLICHISNAQELNDSFAATSRTVNSICRHYKIRRYKLPAFIFISRITDECFIKSIQSPADLEAILSPIRIVEQFYEDIKTSENEEDAKEIKNEYTGRLRHYLSINNQDEISTLFDDESLLLKKLFETISKSEHTINECLDRLNEQIRAKNFNIFISCKSEDYEKAHELYNFLTENGFKPFLADISIRQIGEDRYGDLIRSTIDICSNLIVYASQIDYIETPYVNSEWNLFLDELTAGRKTGKLISIISETEDINRLPIGLRNRQCLRTNAYRDNLLAYLNNCNNPQQNTQENSFSFPERDEHPWG